MKFEVERTRGLFEEGRPLVPRIPGELAVDVDLFSRGGLAILDRIEARGLRRPDDPAGAGEMDQARPAGVEPWPGLAWRRPSRGQAPYASHTPRGLRRCLARSLGSCVHRRGESPGDDGPSACDSYRFCGEGRAAARRGTSTSRSGFCPPRAAGRMCALYAFMRHTDDLADEPGTAAGEGRVPSTAGGTTLDAALDGQTARWPGFAGLADTVERAGIPRLPASRSHRRGLDGPSSRGRYANFDELARYCYHVASAVGLCCLHIWGYRSEGGQAERLAEACGIALQLTNILRDVREDARNGRIYLPRTRWPVRRRAPRAERRPAQRRLRELLASRPGGPTVTTNRPGICRPSSSRSAGRFC